MEIHVLALPVDWEVEGATIGTCVVVDLADVGGLAVKLGFPGIAHVLVGRVAIAVQLEDAGYGEVLPGGIVVVGLEEVRRTLAVVLHEVELPHTLHGEVVGRARLVVALCLVDVLESEEGRTARLPVLLVDVHVLPSGRVLCHGALPAEGKGTTHGDVYDSLLVIHRSVFLINQ